MTYWQSGVLGAALLVILMGCGVSDSETETTSNGSDLIASGEFVSKGGQETSGTYRLERVGDYRRLVFMDDFRTDEGPDLHVVLSPTSAGKAASENAVAQGAVVLDSLSALQGKQVFYLADSLEVSRFESILIHCVEASHLYGAASLEGDGTRASR